MRDCGVSGDSGHTYPSGPALELHTSSHFPYILQHLDEHIESVACTAVSIGWHVGPQSSSNILRCCSTPLFLHPFTQRQAP